MPHTVALKRLFEALRIFINLLHVHLKKLLKLLDKIIRNVETIFPRAVYFAL